MKIMLVDGLLNIRQHYKSQIEKLFPNTQFVESISAEDALFLYFENKPDIIIASDILSNRNARKLSGILYNINRNVPLIVIASDGANAVEAIKNHCFDFLLSPVSDTILKKSIISAVEYINALTKNHKSSEELTRNTKVKLTEGKGYRMLDLDTIACFIADGSYTKVVFNNGDTEYSSYNLGKIENNISIPNFVKLHRSIYVNLQYIRHIDRVKGICKLELINNTIDVKISKKQIKRLEELNVL